MTNNLAVFIKSFIFTQIFIFCLLAGVSIDINSYYLTHNPLKQLENIVRPFSNMLMEEEICRELFKKTSYFLGGKINNINARDYIYRQMPRDFLTANIQALALAEAEYLRPDDSGDEVGRGGTASGLPTVGADIQAVDYEKLKNHQVVLYCTHSSETYIPDSGQATLNGGRYGLINKVAEQIAANLNQKGIKAEFIKNLHDYPDYNLSYTNSRTTVKKIIKANQQNLWLFDIHRDSIPGLTEAERVKIQGENAAPILIIVGTDERKEHPNWQKNLAFAERIAAMGEEKYPGLIKGIRTKAGTYNQEFHSQSLLLEMGSDYNSMAEAGYTAELLADILLEMLKEENS